MQRALYKKKPFRNVQNLVAPGWSDLSKLIFFWIPMFTGKLMKTDQGTKLGFTALSRDEMYYIRITESIDYSKTGIRNFTKVRYRLFHILSVQFISTRKSPSSTSHALSNLSEKFLNTHWKKSLRGRTPFLCILWGKKGIYWTVSNPYLLSLIAGSQIRVQIFL